MEYIIENLTKREIDIMESSDIEKHSTAIS